MYRYVCIYVYERLSTFPADVATLVIFLSFFTTVSVSPVRNHIFPLMRAFIRCLLASTLSSDLLLNTN